MTESKIGKLAERLAELQAAGWEEGEPFSTESMGDLINFLRDHQELAYPSIVLTPVGNLRAEWNRRRGEHFAIEFFGNDAVSYVIFAPGFLSTSGTATVDSIMQIAEPYGVLRWAGEVL